VQLDSGFVRIDNDDNNNNNDKNNNVNDDDDDDEDLLADIRLFEELSAATTSALPLVVDDTCQTTNVDVIEIDGEQHNETKSSVRHVPWSRENSNASITVVEEVKQEEKKHEINEGILSKSADNQLKHVKIKKMPEIIESQEERARIERQAYRQQCIKQQQQRRRKLKRKRLKKEQSSQSADSQLIDLTDENQHTRAFDK